MIFANQKLCEIGSCVQEEMTFKTKFDINKMTGF